MQKYKTIKPSSTGITSKHRSISGNCEPVADVPAGVCEPEMESSKPCGPSVTNIINTVTNIEQTVILSVSKVRKLFYRTTGLEGTSIVFPMLLGIEQVLLISLDSLVASEDGQYESVVFDNNTARLSLQSGAPFAAQVPIHIVYSEQTSSMGGSPALIDTVLTGDGGIEIPTGRVIDMALIIPTVASTLNIGTTIGGSEVAGPESIDANAYYTVGLNRALPGTNPVLYFSGITASTRIKIYLKNETPSIPATVV